jgi:RNA polymerase sigma factor (sigma-70 family)
MGEEMKGEAGPRSDLFEDVLDRHGDALWRLAGAYTDEPRDREDLYQEILVAVWQGLARFRGDSSTRTYVFRIGRNRAVRRDRAWIPE